MKLKFFTFLFLMSSTAALASEGVSNQGNPPNLVVSSSDDPFAALRAIMEKNGQHLNCDPKHPADCDLINWLKAKYKIYKGCEGFFIDPQGNLGGQALLVMQYFYQDIKLNGMNSRLMQNKPQFDKYCPGFKNMTPIQKLGFHAWVMELTAFPESTCGHAKTPAGYKTKDLPVCIYQLNSLHSGRDFRGSDCKKYSPDEILQDKACTACAYDMYMGDLKRTVGPFGEVTPDRKAKQNIVYWAAHDQRTDLELAFVDCAIHAKGKAAVKKCHDDPKYAKIPDAVKNESIAAYNFFRRLPRYPYCGVPGVSGVQ